VGEENRCVHTTVDVKGTDDSPSLRLPVVIRNRRIIDDAIEEEGPHGDDGARGLIPAEPKDARDRVDLAIAPSGDAL